jgi:hypothetical protein
MVGGGATAISGKAESKQNARDRNDFGNFTTQISFEGFWNSLQARCGCLHRRREQMPPWESVSIVPEKHDFVGSAANG